MSNKNCLPSTTAQTSGGKFQTFSNLGNIKNTGSDYAQALVHGKKQPLNRPSTVTAKNFKASLPTGALVTKIVVKYKHSKAKYNGKDCNVQAPSISLMNGDKPFQWDTVKAPTINPNRWNPVQNYQSRDMTKKGKAPTATAKEESVTFTHNWQYNEINPSTFGVKIDYPTNANNNEGYVRLYYVKVEIHYKTASFSFDIQQPSGEYNHDDYEVSITCSNKNLTKYNPSVTVTVPNGFSLKEHMEDGTFTLVNARTYEWIPTFGLKIGSCKLKLVLNTNITYASSVEVFTGNIVASESLNGASKTKSVTVKKTRPADPTIDPTPEPTIPEIDDDQSSPETTEILSLTVNQTFEFDIDLPDDIDEFILYCCTVTNGDFAGYSLSSLSSVMRLRINSQEAWSFQTYGSKIFVKDAEDDDAYSFSLSQIAITTRGAYTLVITPNGSTEVLKVIYVDVKPSGTLTPIMSILTLSQEERNRLGHGYDYRVQSFMKEVSSEGYVRDWGKNFRIGVFNNPILANVTNYTYTDENGEIQEVTSDSTDYDTLSIDDIIANADYWGEPLKTANAFENVECKFLYNKNYPLYILIMGDYSAANFTPVNIQYTEPCIVESDAYTTRESNGIYPIPIDNMVLSEDSAEMTVPALTDASELVFYDLPLDEDYGTNEQIAIRGLALSGILEHSTDNLVLSAKLKNSTNDSKQRSVVLDEIQTTLSDENEFVLGGIGDLWGFSTLDIVNLEDWEAHLTIGNTLNETTGSINIKDVAVTIYIENIEHQNIKTWVNGEDLSYYGVFLTDVKIPEGLKTDTDYLKVNGTDVNDPFRQNIKEKTIEVTFEVGDCDLEGSTNTLREVTRLLVNERDKYNRPIPKTIEFSHYPDIYWEYILEDVLDNEVEYNSYTAKAKLVVPAGTGYDKKPTKTNATGYISGLAHIKPIIQLKPTNAVITVTEELSEQEFNMSYSNDWIGKIVEIDCDNRIVLLKEDDDDNTGDDISRYVDFNSDWFRLLGEYNFTATGCAIASIISQERW